MDKRTLAIDCYILALQKSVYLTEALDALMQHEMLMAWEEKDLIHHIMPMEQNGNEADLKILKHLYESKLKSYYTVQVCCLRRENDEKFIFFLLTEHSSRENAKQCAINQRDQRKDQKK
jgi:hypothetical protein